MTSGTCQQSVEVQSKSVTFLDFRLSQGNVGNIATYCRWGGSLCDVYIENFLTNHLVKEFWKSVHSCQSYYRTSNGLIWAGGQCSCTNSFVLLSRYCLPPIHSLTHPHALTNMLITNWHMDSSLSIVSTRTTLRLHFGPIYNAPAKFHALTILPVQCSGKTLDFITVVTLR